jgi:hypothetical protein
MGSLSKAQSNARDLDVELHWFALLLDSRFKLYFKQDCPYNDIYEIKPPKLVTPSSNYGLFIKKNKLGFTERVMLVLALIPYIRPQLLDVFFTKNKTFDRSFTEFGGWGNKDQNNFKPTAETLLFILAANDLSLRFDLLKLFNDEHLFSKKGVFVNTKSAEQSALNAPLTLSREFLIHFSSGAHYRPEFDAKFPAQFIQTTMRWQDLVLHPATLKNVQEISTWIEHGDTLMQDWQMQGKLRPGYRALFYGPPGTGKTMTACLIGQSTNRDVYKIDLSLLVSKYIGETEKNLSYVFDCAQTRGWILVFDEAEALFSKRSSGNSSTDRYANQEVAYLLQRIEVFDGIVILASNLKEHIDSAFLRRFESITYFALPKPPERLRLWQQGFPKKAKLAKDADLALIAKQQPLSGGAIINIISYISLQSIKEKRPITQADILSAIKRENAKEGKS